MSIVLVRRSRPAAGWKKRRTKGIFWREDGYGAKTSTWPLALGLWLLAFGFWLPALYGNMQPPKTASQNTNSENRQITNPKLCHAPTTIHLTKNHVKTKTRQIIFLITNCRCARHAQLKSALINQNRASNRKLRQTKPRNLCKALTKNLAK